MKRSYVFTAAFVAAASVTTVLAADPKIVTYFEETCGACHGEKGAGIPNLAPALKGNAFVVKGSAAEIGEVITKGRGVEQKKYKDYPSPMPAHSMGDSRLAGVLEYIKKDLQK
jgi:mono/diheme cytochrome c family protein